MTSETCFTTESRINNTFNMYVCLFRVEGRTWYTSHRGRLWIAAAAKKPTPQEIAEVEAMYRHIYNKGKVTVHSRSVNKVGKKDLIPFCLNGNEDAQ